MICYPWTVNWKAQGQEIDEFKYFKRWFAELSARPAVQRGLAVTAGPTEDPESLPAKERRAAHEIAIQSARPTGASGRGIARKLTEAARAKFKDGESEID